MKTSDAVKSLTGLAQETRLSIFRLLVQAGESGMAAGEIARNLEVPNATLSFHLKELANADLVRSRQESRFIYYAANFAAMSELLAFLTENCCSGQPCGIASPASQPAECRADTAPTDIPVDAWAETLKSGSGST